MKTFAGYCAGLLVLAAAMALVTWGLVTWTVQNFSLASLWPFSGDLTPHPVHLLAIGLVVLPMAFRLLASPAVNTTESADE